MARTRSKAGAGASASTPSANGNASTASKYTLPADSENPPRVFVLPKAASAEAKVCSLPNPRYSRPMRYLVCPESGIYEFTRICAPKSSPRSWLLDGCTSSSEGGGGGSFEAQTSKSADLYIASPIDPLFLVLPALIAQRSSSSSDTPKKRMFLSADDHLEALSQEASHLEEVLRWGRVRSLLEARMAAACDTVEAGDETMFRLSEDKLLREILAKARRMSERGLPRSMEDKFVKKTLEAPVMGVRARAAPTSSSSSPSDEQAGNGSTATPETASQTPTPLADASSESQSSTASGDSLASSASEATTAATSVSPADSEPSDSGAGEVVVSTAMKASDEVVSLQRLRVAFQFICSSYLPPKLAESLKGRLADPKSGAAAAAAAVDFGPLDEYMTRLAQLRQEAALARLASDFSHKRGREDEDDEDRAEKRRKKEEEEKRKKASESRGVRELKKVNVSGMRKLSEFFKKK